MKKILIAVCTTVVTMAAQADLVYQDDFASDPNIGGVGSAWDDNVTTVATYDAANEQVDYAHVAGTTRRWVNHNNVDFTFASTEGYMKAAISNFTGSPDGVWIGFVEDNTANNANYITADVVGDNTFELVFNNSSASIAYDNGAGWSGTLAANSGLVTTDGGSSSSALTFGSAVDSDVALKGFGFANFGNATVFPSASFSVDSIEVWDTAVVPEASTFGLIALAGGVLALGRRRKA